LASPSNLTMVRPIHPSTLYWAAVCPRRFVGMHGDNQLPPTLAAVRGRILHAVREDLAAQLDRSSKALRTAAEAVFLAARTREQNRLEQRSWWMEWFDLGEHLPWNEARSVVLPMANRLAGITSPAPRRRAAPTQAGAAGAAEPDFPISNHVDPLPGIEVLVACADLGLRGVVDEVRQGADGWIVVEMKTTERAAGGEAAKIQAYTYAMALERAGGGSVSHCEILGPRGPFEIPFDEDARRCIMELLEVAQQADETEASPGTSACGGCPVRDSCTAYRDWTERQWAEGWPVAESDVWGDVDSVVPAEDETFTVDLAKPDGARALVRGVPLTRPGLDAGAAIEAFGLRPTGTQRLHGAPAAPTALHERPVGVARGLPPAWGAFWQLR